MQPKKNSYTTSDLVVPSKTIPEFQTKILKCAKSILAGAIIGVGDRKREVNAVPSKLEPNVLVLE